MTNTRNAKTDEALTWLGSVLSEYVTGDYSNRDIVEGLSISIMQNTRRHGDDPEAEQYAVLRALAGLREALDDELRVQVERSRGARADVDDAVLSWAKIGDALGMSRQSAHERFSGGYSTVQSRTYIAGTGDRIAR